MLQGLLQTPPDLRALGDAGGDQILAGYAQRCADVLRTSVSGQPGGSLCRDSSAVARSDASAPASAMPSGGVAADGGAQSRRPLARPAAHPPSAAPRSPPRRCDRDRSAPNSRRSSSAAISARGSSMPTRMCEGQRQRGHRQQVRAAVVSGSSASARSIAPLIQAQARMQRGEQAQVVHRGECSQRHPVRPARAAARRRCAHRIPCPARARPPRARPARRCGARSRTPVALRSGPGAAVAWGRRRSSASCSTRSLPAARSSNASGAACTSPGRSPPSVDGNRVDGEVAPLQILHLRARAHFRQCARAPDSAPGARVAMSIRPSPPYERCTKAFVQGQLGASLGILTGERVETPGEIARERWASSLDDHIQLARRIDPSQQVAHGAADQARHLVPAPGRSARARRAAHARVRARRVHPSARPFVGSHRPP